MYVVLVVGFKLIVFGVIFEVLGGLEELDLWMTFGPQGDPLDVQGPFYMDLGCHYGGLHFTRIQAVGLGTPLDRALGNDFSIHALEREKPYNFMLLSFKIKD